MCKVEPHSPIKFEIPLVVDINSKLRINQNIHTYTESFSIPVAFNSKPNFEGFKIHNFFIKIYEK